MKSTCRKLWIHIENEDKITCEFFCLTPVFLINFFSPLNLSLGAVSPCLSPTRFFTCLVHEEIFVDSVNHLPERTVWAEVKLTYRCSEWMLLENWNIDVVSWHLEYWVATQWYWGIHVICAVTMCLVNYQSYLPLPYVEKTSDITVEQKCIFKKLQEKRKWW